MKVECFTVEERAAAASPADDPRQAHLKSCLRCQALQSAYQAFLTPAPDLLDAEARAVEAELGDFLRREILAEPMRPVARHERRTLLGRIGRVLAAPPLRPAWAAAVGLVVVSAVIFLAIPRRDQPIVLRGGRQPGSTTPGVVALEAPRPAPAGGVELRWHAVEGADRYTVAFFTAELKPLSRVEAGDTTRLALAPGAVPAAPAGSEVFWRVTALRKGAALAESHLETVRLP